MVGYGTGGHFSFVPSFLFFDLYVVFSGSFCVYLLILCVISYPFCICYCWSYLLETISTDKTQNYPVFIPVIETATVLEFHILTSLTISIQFLLMNHTTLHFIHSFLVLINLKSVQVFALPTWACI